MSSAAFGGLTFFFFFITLSYHFQFVATSFYRQHLCIQERLIHVSWAGYTKASFIKDTS